MLKVFGYIFSRRMLLATAIIASLSLPLTPFTQENAIDPDDGDKALELRGNVVRVTRQGGDGLGIGFGFIVGHSRESLYVITAEHVALESDPDAEQIDPKVIFYSSRDKPYSATVVGHNHPHDVALLKVDRAPKTAWRRDCLAPGGDATRGTPVVFIGRSDRWDVPATKGNISSAGLTAERWLMADLGDIREGSSGAPLVTKTGIIGMVKGDAGGTTKILSIEFIRDAVKEWNGPWELSVGKIEKAVTPVPASQRGPISNRGMFSIPAAYKSGGKFPNSLTVGDFDGDGKLDVAVANSDDNNVGILLGNGDGTFREPHTYPAGDVPYAIRAGDFNHDGRLDLAVTNISYTRNDPTVSILLGNGDGTFQPPQNVRVGYQPTDLAIGDFNRDGSLDVAVASRVRPEVNVLLGHGDGSFSAPVIAAVKQLPVYALAVGDLNNDGSPDIVAGDHHYVSVLLGNGDGTYAEAQNYLANTGNWGAYSTVLGDFNRDRKLDVAVANFSGNGIGVLLGNGDGSLQAEVSFTTDVGPFVVTSGDFNRDGKIDLVSANNSGTVSVLLGRGDGSFQLAQNYAAGNSPSSVAVGDFNGDGWPDLVVADRASDGIKVLLNQSGGTLLLLSSSSNPSTANSPVIFTVVVPQRLGKTGIVRFKSDDDILGTMPLIDGVATVSTSALTPGSHTITAVYTSSSAASYSSNIMQTVSPY